MAKQKKSLGRGVDALLGQDYLALETFGTSSINEISLLDIIPNPEQPRSSFEEESLEELAESIRHVGIIQPITISEMKDQPGRYRIISGERRYRAAQKAGLLRLPAYIRVAEDQQIMEMALIENIQREDLNAIEIALAFKNLIDNYNLTQEALSTRVGKKRATISNYLRLLRLPAEIQIGLKDSKIDMGHARALLSLSEPPLQLSLYERILKESLSVRQVEEIVRAYATKESPQSLKPKKSSPKRQDQDFEILSKRFSDLFHTKVSIAQSEDGKGRITISFRNDEEFEGILSLLDRL